MNEVVSSRSRVASTLACRWLRGPVLARGEASCEPVRDVPRQRGVVEFILRDAPKRSGDPGVYAMFCLPQTDQRAIGFAHAAFDGVFAGDAEK